MIYTDSELFIMSEKLADKNRSNSKQADLTIKQENKHDYKEYLSI